MTTPARIANVVIPFLAACGPTQTYVADTDHLVRKPHLSFFAIPQLLAKPPGASREIGTVGGYVSADRDDDQLWREVGERAARLGANAIQLVKRELVNCTHRGSSAVYLTTIGGVTSGTVESQASGLVPCVHLVVKALITAQDVQCDRVPICRTDRADARVMKRQ